MCASLVFWVTGLHPRVCTFGFPLRVSSLYQVFLFSFLFFSPPYAFYPSFASFRDDPSSRSFFEILLRDGGERRRKEDVLFSKSVDEIIVKNESTRL